MSGNGRLRVPPHFAAALTEWTGINDDAALKRVFIELLHYAREVGGRPSGADLAPRVAMFGKDGDLAARLCQVRTRFDWPDPFPPNPPVVWWV